MLKSETKYMYDDISHPVYRADFLSKYQNMFGDRLEKLRNYEVFYWPSFA